MWVPARLTDGRTTSYGLGWSVFPQDCRRLTSVGHNGGRNNTLVHLVGCKVTVIVLCNLSGADAFSLANEVAAHYLDSPEGDEPTGRTSPLAPCGQRGDCRSLIGAWLGSDSLPAGKRCDRGGCRWTRTAGSRTGWISPAATPLRGSVP
jgi:hypothetical protein